jgi:hypothetical protein
VLGVDGVALFALDELRKVHEWELEWSPGYAPRPGGRLALAARESGVAFSPDSRHVVAWDADLLVAWDTVSGDRMLDTEGSLCAWLDEGRVALICATAFPGGTELAARAPDSGEQRWA